MDVILSIVRSRYARGHMIRPIAASVAEARKQDDRLEQELRNCKAKETLAELLINQCVLYLSKDGAPHRIVELEFYSGGSEDPFGHNHPEQITTACWYLHRAGTKVDAKHKNGTYRGWDITWGGNRLRAGILVRSILNCATMKTVVGPCKVALAMETANSKTSPTDMYEALRQRQPEDPEAGLSILQTRHNGSGPTLVFHGERIRPKFDVHATPRYGLTMKRHNGTRAGCGIIVPWRFEAMSQPAQSSTIQSKYRGHAVAGQLWTVFEEGQTRVFMKNPKWGINGKPFNAREKAQIGKWQPYINQYGPHLMRVGYGDETVDGAAKDDESPNRTKRRRTTDERSKLSL